MKGPTPDGLLVCLAEAAVRGDEDAMERLLTELHVDLLRYLRRWLRFWRQGDELAMEIAQETLVRVARGLHSFRGTSNGQLVSWARAVAANLAKDAAREARGEWDAVVFGEELDELDAHEPDLPLGNDDDTPGSQGRKVVLRLLGEALQGGNEEAQALLWHRLVQGDSWADAGAAVGLTHTAAKRRCQRLQERLRSQVLERIESLPAADAAAARRWLAHLEASTPAGLP
ncbi:RNA polymerase sigma factor [Longimicrobium sp.]|uniref:RNA polymerase sigma factor n=1 Tax=Longimicrobium sp. TaxID=2029185 RepID=UPI003B3A27B3